MTKYKDGRMLHLSEILVAVDADGAPAAAYANMAAALAAHPVPLSLERVDPAFPEMGYVVRNELGYTVAKLVPVPMVGIL